MRVLLIKKNKIENFYFNDNVDGNYWIYDYDKNNKVRNLLSLSENNGTWILNENDDVKILVNGVATKFFNVHYYSYCDIYIVKTKETYTLFFSPIFDKTYTQYKLNNTVNEITIGSSPTNIISCRLPKILPNHVKIYRQNNKFVLQSLDSNGIYINNKNYINKVIENGDVIFVMGLKIIIINDTFIINNPNRSVVFANRVFSFDKINPIVNIDSTDSDDVELYDNDDYFFRAPRFVTKIEHSKVQIDSPPEPEKKEDKPLLYIVGPMLTMGLISVVMAWNALSGVMDGTRKFSSAIPALVMAGAMLCSMILWPMLNKNYEKKKRLEHEEERKEKYKVYIDSKRKVINEILEWQRKTIIENNVDLKSCEDIIMNRKRSLWERKKDHDDFLNITIGIGDKRPDIEFNYQEAHFSMSNDNLRSLLDSLVIENEVLKNVPITFSFVKKYITAIVGNNELTKKFIDAIILRLLTFHSYEDIKLVIFTNKKNESKWEYLKMLPFCWNGDNTIRFFGTNAEEISQITTYLYEVIQKRIEFSINNNSNKHEIITPYYIIITDDFYPIRNNEFIKCLLEQDINMGFTLLINNNGLLGLPDECKTFINIDAQNSAIFENELVTEKQIEFRAEFMPDNINIYNCILSLSNLPIMREDGEFLLPDSISFLELYNVGDIDQLNIFNRWKSSNPAISLASPVGINKNGDILKLDLHEKYHGPHGLIAGMTGSGKSEFIITYILSLAINYSPHEVQFVLIDYKGGGLAGAFFNSETGVKLPHLCGVITNLETVEIKRNFASIESELKRRQQLFAKVREQLNESTIDIYKYQKFYRDGIVEEPVSHLFIISDEFAELKSQQPEFMDQLISIARIGRSLGVHLILATQKPSGVVNDQIWSNSKFKVCLRVQDRSDSMDMIKVPDAALIKQVGRFYFQVGYNEYFTMGQAAYAGAQYYKTQKYKKTVDTSINFVDNTGEIIKSINDNNSKNIKSYGEELPNIVKYLSDLATNLKIKVRQLWLEKIPAMIFVDKLAQKHNYRAEKFKLNPIVGEYDNPSKQEQKLVTINLSDYNTIIYGMPGSGKMLALNSIIYSLITAHTTDELNLYLIDFGTETLRMFSKIPQVGDVVLLSDEEKLQNLIKMLKSEIDNRKNILVEYNGDYDLYVKNNPNSLPRIVVIINNFDVFKDTYANLDDDLLLLTREGAHYGITFVITASSTSSVRYKLSQNFASVLSLQLANPSDYIALFGRTNGMVPSKILGRGLIKYDELYEFQVAHITNDEDLMQTINDLGKILVNNGMKKAKRIPVVPNSLPVKDVLNLVTDISNIPIGVYKETIDTAYFNFKNKYVSLISGNDIYELSNFIYALTDIFASIKNTSPIIIDPNNIFNNYNKESIVYYNERFDEVFDKLFEIMNTLKNNTNNSINFICMFVGFDNFKNKLSKDRQDRFNEFLTLGKNIGIFKFIIVDTIINIKKNEFSDWYKNYVTNNEAIFIGNNLGQQFTIKLTKQPRFLNEELPKGYGYNIRSGIPYIIKLVEHESIKK